MMAWVKIDDQFSEHPKVLMAGPAGVSLQSAALCYCSKYLTDGFIPQVFAESKAKQILEQLIDQTLNLCSSSANLPFGFSKNNIDPRPLIDLMVSLKLWELAPRGYLIHDYLEYNPSKDKVTADREQRKAAGQRGASKTNEKRSSRQNSGDSLTDPTTDPSKSGEMVGGPPTFRRQQCQGNVDAQASPRSPSPTPDINKAIFTDHDTKIANPIPDTDIPPDFSKEKSDTDSPPPPPPDKIEAPEFPPDPPPKRDILIPESSRIVVKACRLHIEKKLGTITDGEVYILLAGQNGYEGFGSAARLNFAVDHIKNNPDNPVRKPVAILNAFLKNPNNYLNDDDYDAWKRLRGS